MGIKELRQSVTKKLVVKAIPIAERLKRKRRIKETALIAKET